MLSHFRLTRQRRPRQTKRPPIDNRHVADRTMVQLGAFLAVESANGTFDGDFATFAPVGVPSGIGATVVLKANLEGVSPMMVALMLARQLRQAGYEVQAYTVGSRYMLQVVQSF
jgi:hypothetical protein